MAHRNRGIYGLLESATVYGLMQRALGAHAGRLRFVREYVHPAPNSKILDIGCGPGDLRGVLPVDADYVGIDLNPQYVASARRRFPIRSRFLCADARSIGELGVGSDFDLVLLVALLHHLDDDDARRLLNAAHEILKPGGRLVTLDCVYHPGQGALSQWVISRDRGSAVRTAEGYQRLVSERYQRVRGSLVTDLLRIPYSHFVLCAERAA